jgi:hypothetical protein
VGLISRLVLVIAFAIAAAAIATSAAHASLLGA